MAATDPPLNRPGTEKPASHHSPLTLVETNTLLRRAIQKLPAEIRGSIVLRCDELARLQGNEEAIENAFSRLLQMIVEERQTGKQLFLHITCSQQKEEDTIPSGLPRFFIRFHTNLSPSASWMQEAESRINNIASFLLPYGGSLLVNQLKNSGCVFCITLPGK
ncbi:MAG TPA: hypothetical protein VF609_15510 [Flavisolibacter sp.]|jgi:hypothetical protein